MNAKCHKFQGDSKAMRQHMAGHDVQSQDDWFERYKVLKPEFPCIQGRTQIPWMGVLCGLRPKTRNQHTIVSWSRR